MATIGYCVSFFSIIYAFIYLQAVLKGLWEKTFRVNIKIWFMAKLFIHSPSMKR